MILKPTNYLWMSVLNQFFDSPIYEDISKFIYNEKKAGKWVYPSEWNIFNAFNYFPPDRTKVVIVGQDPYHGPGQANGLAFSMTETNPKKYPPTLRNILKVVEKDVKVKCKSGNLMYWATQGVLLLNTSLTVEHGKPGSHANIGWDVVSDLALNYLSLMKQPIVFMLWGEQAKKKRSIIEGNPHQLILETSHPSPLSVHKGFAFCKHFSKANEFLKANHKVPIDWST